MNLCQFPQVKYRLVQVQHPPYLPDIALYNFFLFPKLKIHLKGKI